MNCGANLLHPCDRQNYSAGKLQCFLFEAWHKHLVFGIGGIESLNLTHSLFVTDGSLFVTDRPHNLKSGVVIGIVVGIVALLALTGILVFVFKCRHKGYRRDQFVDVSGLFLLHFALLYAQMHTLHLTHKSNMIS